MAKPTSKPPSKPPSKPTSKPMSRLELAMLVNSIYEQTATAKETARRTGTTGPTGAILAVHYGSTTTDPVATTLGRHLRSINLTSPVQQLSKLIELLEGDIKRHLACVEAYRQISGDLSAHMQQLPNGTHGNEDELIEEDDA